MVSQNTLDLLSSGKVLWQQWRRTHPDVQAFKPDLHGADLHGADLREFDLYGADLTEANLQDANLQGANLQDADLRSANLRRAEQVFLIRERLSASEGPEPNDRHVRSFDHHRDAYLYASSVNEIQRKLDEQYGHWAQHAIEER